MASQHLGTVCQTIKVGREMALLGNYEGALEKYNVVHGDVQKYIEAERPCTYQRNWQNSSTLLTRESELVNNVNDALAWFTNGGTSGHISSGNPNNSGNTNNNRSNVAVQQPPQSYIPVTSNSSNNNNSSSNNSNSTSSNNNSSNNNSSNNNSNNNSNVRGNSSARRTDSSSSNNNNNNPWSSNTNNTKPTTRVSSMNNSNNNNNRNAPVSRPTPSTRVSNTNAVKPSTRKAALDTGKSSGSTSSNANANSNNTKSTKSNTSNSNNNSNETELINGIPKYTNETYPELVKIIETSIMDVAPNIRFTDIAELDDAKRVQEESVMYPIWMPEFFQGIRKPWKGVLLFGPPGTGKTMLAKAVATECKTTFFNVSASALASKFRGESEQLVHILFEMARYYAPSTIFLDELDSISSRRGVSGEHEASRRVKSQLLIEMDGASSHIEGKPVAVLGATNFPWDLDEAQIRRLEKRIHIPLPGQVGRKTLLEISFKNIKLAPDVDLDILSEATEGYSGSDLCTIARDAAMAGLRKLRQMGVAPAEIIRLGKEVTDAPITMESLTDAITRIHSSVGKHDLERYSSWAQEFGAV